jgi:hypothetical protein
MKNFGMIGPVILPTRDMREWVVTYYDTWTGCIHQHGNGCLEAHDQNNNCIAGFQKFEDAYQAVVSARVVKDYCGIHAAVLAPY